MGHALDNTLQDILIRTKRMQGYDTLWIPGTDHASIATEAKIVEAMAKEGIKKEDKRKNPGTYNIQIRHFSFSDSAKHTKV